MRVKLTKDAAENYPEEYTDKVMVVTHTATRYMPSKEFFARNMPEGYHPGYDQAANGTPLYDLKLEETNEPVPFSLYRWEVRNA